MLRLIARRKIPVVSQLIETPRRAAVVLSILYAVGGAVTWIGLLMQVSHRRDVPGWLAAVAIGGGTTIAGFALYGLHDAIFNWIGRGPTFLWHEPNGSDASADTEFHRGRQSYTLGLGLVVYLLIAGTCLIMAAAGGYGLLALVGSWLAGLGLGAWTAAMRHSFAHKEGHPGLWTIRGAAIFGVAAVFAIWMLRTDSVLILAGLFAMLGLSAMSLGLLVLGEKSQEVWSAVGLSVIGTSVVSATVLWLADAALVALLPSVALFAVGFIPLSNAAPKLVKNTERWKVWTARLLGIGIGAVLAVSLSTGHWPVAWAVAIVVLIALLTLALVAEVFELAVVLVIGVVMAGVLAAPIGPEESDPHPEAAQRIVVFGDSYISGEGAVEFVAGTNETGGDECRTATTAYAHLVADELTYGLDFYACSGAKTFEIVPGAAGALESPDDTQVEQFLADEAAAVAQGEEPRPIAAVLVSAGGNDAWFGTVGQACLGPGTCDVHRTTLLRNVNEIGDRIGNVYAGIKAAVGDEVPIVAMPYPLILTEKGCDDSPLTRQEHAFLFEFTEVLNERARVEAAKAGIHWFAAGIIAFDGHRICDVPRPAAEGDDEVDGMAVNIVDISPKQGVLVDRMLPTNWLHGSAHPNENGHQLTANALQDWLADIIRQAGTQNEDGESAANPTARTVANRQPPPRPTVVSTRSLGIPADLGCITEDLPVSVIVRPESLGTIYNLTGVTPASTVCHNRPDGGWQATEVVSEDGTVDVPAWGREIALDFDSDRVAPRQVLVWQRGSTGQWQVTVGEYCELDPACPDSEEEIQEWMVAQIGRTINTATLPVLLMFLGAWFLAIEIKRRVEADNETPDDG